MSSNRLKNAVKNACGNIKSTMRTKSAGFFVGVAACATAIACAIAYVFVPSEIYNGNVIVCLAVGVALFAVLSLFKTASEYAPIALMICSMSSLFPFAYADGLIDYVGTQFFDGVSVQKIFSLPPALLLSIILILITVILSSVAMYLKQNKTKESESVVLNAEGNGYDG